MHLDLSILQPYPTPSLALQACLPLHQAGHPVLVKFPNFRHQPSHYRLLLTTLRLLALHCLQQLTPTLLLLVQQASRLLSLQRWYRRLAPLDSQQLQPLSSLVTLVRLHQAQR